MNSHGAILGLGATSIVGSVRWIFADSILQSKRRHRHGDKSHQPGDLGPGSHHHPHRRYRSQSFLGLLTTIPLCRLGGATIPVFASIAMTGIKLASLTELRRATWPSYGSLP